MKKFALTACVFVLCLACGFGLSACSIGEVKENTSAVIETSTGIIPVEYSKGLATNLLQAALTNLNSISYSYTIETRNLIGGAFQDVENPGANGTYTFINDFGNNEMYADFSNFGKSVMKVLKNADNQAKYYDINIDTKKYRVMSGEIGNSTFSGLLNCVTDGMCYNGISYINCCQDNGSEQKDYYQVQIKDGLIQSIMYTDRDADSMRITSQSTCNFSYENIERPMYLPDTVEGLERLGYQLVANN